MKQIKGLIVLLLLTSCLMMEAVAKRVVRTGVVTVGKKGTKKFNLTRYLKKKWVKNRIKKYNKKAKKNKKKKQFKKLSKKKKIKLIKSWRKKRKRKGKISKKKNRTKKGVKRKRVLKKKSKKKSKKRLFVEKHVNKTWAKKEIKKYGEKRWNKTFLTKQRNLIKKWKKAFKKNKKKFSLKRYLKKKWVNNRIKKYGEKKWRKLSKKKKIKLIKKWRKRRNKKGKKKLLRTGKTGMGILIDHGVENPEEEKIRPVTQRLKMFIEEKRFPVLASASLFYNFIYRKVHWKKSKKNKKLKKVVFSRKDWDLFHVPDTQLLLLVPQKNNKKIRKYFNIKKENFKDLSKLINKPNKLIKYIRKMEKPGLDDIADFKKVFRNKRELEKAGLLLSSLVVYVNGHGSLGRYLANLDIKVFQRLLDLLKGAASHVFVATCFGGGQHTQFMKYFDDGQTIVRSYPYTLVVQGIEDATTDRTFFPLIEFLKRMVAGQKIEGVIKEIASLESEQHMHGQKNLPQIMFPNTFDFVPMAMSDEITSITNKLLEAHKSQDNKPIRLWASGEDEQMQTRGPQDSTLKQDPFIVLVQQDVDVPLQVRLKDTELLERKKSGFLTVGENINIKKWSEEEWAKKRIKKYGKKKWRRRNKKKKRNLLKKWKKKQLRKHGQAIIKVGDLAEKRMTFWDDCNVTWEYMLENMKKIRAAYSNKKKRSEYSALFGKQFNKKRKLIKSDYSRFLFPVIISMKRIEKVEKGSIIEQSFSEINVFGQVKTKESGVLTLPYVGVMNFLRDAFFDVSPTQKSLKIFNIAKLTGPNDILSMLQAVRLVEKNKKKSALEKRLEAFGLDQELSLDNVFVEVGFNKIGFGSESDIVKRFGFVIKGTGKGAFAKDMAFRIDKPWNFVQEDDVIFNLLNIDVEKKATKAIAYARRAIMSNSWYQQSVALNIWKKLFSMKKGFKDALKLIDKELLEDSSTEEKKGAKELRVLLFNNIDKITDKTLKKKVIDKTLAVAQQRMNSTDEQERDEFSDDWKALFSLNQGYDQALLAAQKGIKSSSEEVLLKAIMMWRYLLNKIKNFSKTISKKEFLDQFAAAIKKAKKSKFKEVQEFIEKEELELRAEKAQKRL